MNNSRRSNQGPRGGVQESRPRRSVQAVNYNEKAMAARRVPPPTVDLEEEDIFADMPILTPEAPMEPERFIGPQFWMPKKKVIPKSSKKSLAPKKPKEPETVEEFMKKYKMLDVKLDIAEHKGPFPDKYGRLVEAKAIFPVPVALEPLPSLEEPRSLRPSSQAEPSSFNLSFEQEESVIRAKPRRLVTTPVELSSSPAKPRNFSESLELAEPRNFITLDDSFSSTSIIDLTCSTPSILSEPSPDLFFSAPSSPIPSRMTREEFREELKKLKPASKEFLNLFVEYEDQYFDNGNVEVLVFPDGHNYQEKIREFNKLYKFLKRDGLGMEKPERIGLEGVPDYLDLNSYVSVIDSSIQQSESMLISDLLDAFKVPIEERTGILNMLSLEFTDSQPGLNEVFKVPQFVRDHSIIQKLETILNRKMEEIKKELDKETISKKKKMLKSELSRVKGMNMPRYQKFLLVSMEGSFTDIHVDFSATGVYYHVDTGKKVFYVAPPTSENLDVYTRFEKKQLRDEEKGRWIGDVLFDQWTRIEINPGETVLMPSGYIHFVYTPADSLVIGGNFLMEKYFELQFRLTELEEHLLDIQKTIDKGYMLQGFRGVMWAYMDLILIPQLKEMEMEEVMESSLREWARIFLREMKPSRKLKPEWYTVEERWKMMKELKELLPSEDRRRSRRPLADIQLDMPTKRMRV